MQSNLTALIKPSGPVCAGMTWRRLFVAGTMRQWRLRPEEINREARHFGVGIREGVGQVASRPRVHHEAKNWLVFADCSNVFNTVRRTAVLVEATTCVPALTPFVAKCYDEISASVFFQMDSGEGREFACSGGVQQGNAMGPALSCMSLLSLLKRAPRGVRAKGCRSVRLLGRHQHRDDGRTSQLIPWRLRLSSS